VSALPLHCNPDHPEALESILRQVGEGDGQAFERLYRRMSPRVYRYLASRELSKEVVEEALQDTFLAVWRDARAFCEGSTTAWIFGIARHKRADAWKQQPRISVQSVEADGWDVTPDPKSESEYLAVEMRAILAEWSSSDRELAHLVFVEALSYREVAQVLGIPIGTVKSRVARIRRHWQEEALEDV
jgi:RNA polymerase sigma-70 factor (ECF subfamily)